MQESKDTVRRKARRTSKNQKKKKKKLLSPIINKIQTDLKADESNFLLYLTSELFSHTHKICINIRFNFNTKIIADHIHQILNNINTNNNVNENIEYFVNTYVGNTYSKIFKIFHIENIQLFDDIIEILDNKKVKDYLAIGAIRDRLDIDLDKKRFFNGGIDNPSENNYPVNFDTFKNDYLMHVKKVIDGYKHNINNIKEYIDNETEQYTNNLQFSIYNIDRKNIIKDRINTHMNDREQYLNQKLKEITDNIDNVY